jgi:hypothetical protein
MPTVKTISPGGQISLGKKYAGRTVIIDNPEEGVWVVKTASVIPDNERWLHQEPAKSKLEAAIRRAEQRLNRTSENVSPDHFTSLEELEAQALNRLEGSLV